VRGAKLPLEYMLAVLADENAPQARRDQMAAWAAPYCHPKLSSVVTSNTNVNYKGGGDILQIYAVPHRGRIADDGSITIDGQAVELSSIEPYAGTPGLPAPTDAPAPIEPPERLEVLEVDTSNVTVLRKRDDPSPV
jgi:hypothetical protein